MVAAEARVPTTLASRYMTQLCKHFEHKLPVSYDSAHGRIEFTSGVCTLAAEPETLVMRTESADEETLTKLQGTVVRHLERFAFRDPPPITWNAVSPA